MITTNKIFPTIDEEERLYEDDLLTDWRFVADGKRRLRQDQLSDEMIGNSERINKNKTRTLEELLGIWYIYEENKDDWTLLYYMAEKDKDWNIIIDKENKNIKFIDEKTGKIITETYIWE